MTKYRFKTKEEFAREGLLDYEGVPKGWNSEGAMNRFLGADIPIKYNALCDRKEEISIDSWHFTSKDYILKSISKPKYRLKTEEEFKRDGEWAINCPEGWASGMNKHLGKTLDSKYNVSIDEARLTNRSLTLTIDDEFWSFRHTNFVLIDTLTFSRDWKSSMERDVLSTQPTWYDSPMYVLPKREEKQRVEPMKNIR